jgi:hypothetical protein
MQWENAAANQNALDVSPSGSTLATSSYRREKTRSYNTVLDLSRGPKHFLNKAQEPEMTGVAFGVDLRSCILTLIARHLVKFAFKMNVIVSKSGIQMDLASPESF